ncbi:putative rRNA methylase [Dillenia turbinata]|uniref:rRNA methylase n=1 Tax=Dillenia turbinata TaxID=194707 RepID=A0AAN8VII8_9MAGN
MEYLSILILFQGLKMWSWAIFSGRRRPLKLLTRRVWERIVRRGDIVVDATCGNGYDTLAMVKMVADEPGSGCVYGFDIQENALENTSFLLDHSLSDHEKKLVKLYGICHSRMEEVIPSGALLRLVAFNLGYLPGGDKAIITTSKTTLQALEVAEKLLAPGGLISLVVYVGHPRGREEFETVQEFASGLSVENWVCCKFEMLNRPLAPVLVFLFKS